MSKLSIDQLVKWLTRVLIRTPTNQLVKRSIHLVKMATAKCKHIRKWLSHESRFLEDVLRLSSFVQTNFYYPVVLRIKQPCSSMSFALKIIRISTLKDTLNTWSTKDERTWERNHCVMRREEWDPYTVSRERDSNGHNINVKKEKSLINNYHLIWNGFIFWKV